MTATLTRSEPHVEQDEFSQAPAKLPATNGDAHEPDQAEPTLAEAQEILARATEEAKAVLARAVTSERVKIDEMKMQRDALDKSIGEREAALAVASGGKVRKKRAAKAPASDPRVVADDVALLEIGKPYSVRDAKALFGGRKPGEVLAEAIAANVIKVGGTSGMGKTYTRTK